jgi:hypothetical protein
MAPPSSDSSSDSDANKYIALPSSQKQSVFEVSDEEHIVEEDLLTDEEEDDFSSEEQEEVIAPFNSSKPIKAQPQAQAQTTPSSGKKHAVDDNAANGTKHSKKKKSVTAANSGRVFSDEEGLAIQNDIVDFISKTGNNPLKDSKAFHNFMKDSIRDEITTKQLKRKVCDFKEKFEKGKWKYDKTTFELFERIGWRNNGVNEAEKGKGKIVHEKSDDDINLLVNEMFSFGNNMGLCTMSMTKEAAKKGLELIEDSKRAELMVKWRQIRIAAMNVLADQAELTKDQANLILKELKKSTN